MLIHQNNNQYLIVLDKDQKLVATLTELAQKHKILGGTITGLGALKNVELGFYELHEEDYIRRKFTNEDFELISLTGNITLKEGTPYIHVHAALGRNDFNVFGGHLFEAEVAVTAEIHITPFGILPERVLNPSVGLATISRCQI